MSKIKISAELARAAAAVEGATSNLEAMANHFGWTYRGERYRKAERRVAAAREKYNAAFQNEVARIVKERKCEAIEAEGWLSSRLSKIEYDYRERQLRRIIES